MKQVVMGAIAGAAGTMAINMTSYGDQALRGRNSSTMPADVVRKLAQSAGIESLSKPDNQIDESTKNRRQALGALSGYGIGLSIGLLYGAVRPSLRGVHPMIAAAVLGALAMAASEVPAAKLDVADLSRWNLTTWLSDIIPHAVYGIVTALVFDRISSE